MHFCISILQSTKDILNNVSNDVTHAVKVSRVQTNFCVPQKKAIKVWNNIRGEYFDLVAKMFNLALITVTFY